MLPSPCYVLSDAHLGAAPPEAERDLVALLRRLPDDAKSLVINGDLFDFWFEWKHVIPRVGLRVLAELARLSASGIPVLWIAGNHDCWGGTMLRDELGLDYRVGRWRGALAGWDTVLDHGDGLREREDAPYRRLRTVLRHPWSQRAFGWLHPDWGTALAMRSSHTSRNYQPSDRGAGLRAVAHAQLAASDAPELLVFGHSHVTTLETAGRGVFANPGAWMDTPQFLRVTAEQVELCRWSAGARIVERSIARPSRSEQ